MPRSTVTRPRVSLQPTLRKSSLRSTAFLGSASARRARERVLVERHTPLARLLAEQRRLRARRRRARRPPRSPPRAPRGGERGGARPRPRRRARLPMRRAAAAEPDAAPSGEITEFPVERVALADLGRSEPAVDGLASRRARGASVPASAACSAVAGSAGVATVKAAATAADGTTGAADRRARSARHSARRRRDGAATGAATGGGARGARARRGGRGGRGRGGFLQRLVLGGARAKSARVSAAARDHLRARRELGVVLLHDGGVDVAERGRVAVEHVARDDAFDARARGREVQVVPHRLPVAATVERPVLHVALRARPRWRLG